MTNFMGPTKAPPPEGTTGDYAPHPVLRLRTKPPPLSDATATLLAQYVSLHHLTESEAVTIAALTEPLQSRVAKRLHRLIIAQSIAVFNAGYLAGIHAQPPGQTDS